MAVLVIADHDNASLKDSTNKTVTAIDTLTFRPVASGTEVTYAAEFTFKGPSRILAPLLKPAFERLGNEAEAGMRTALNRL